MPPPWIVKPVLEDASVGIDEDSVHVDLGSLREQLVRRTEARPGLRILVEHFVEGREFNIGVLPRADGVPMFHVSGGRLRLRASAALGLLGMAVFAPENRGENAPPTYTLGWQQHTFHVAGWWGWQDHFREIVRNARITSSPLELGPEWSNWQALG